MMKYAKPKIVELTWNTVQGDCNHGSGDTSGCNTGSEASAGGLGGTTCTDGTAAVNSALFGTACGTGYSADATGFLGQSCNTGISPA